MITFEISPLGKEIAALLSHIYEITALLWRWGGERDSGDIITRIYDPARGGPIFEIAGSVAWPRGGAASENRSYQHQRRRLFLEVTRLHSVTSKEPTSALCPRPPFVVATG